MPSMRSILAAALMAAALGPRADAPGARVAAHGGAPPRTDDPAAWSAHASGDEVLALAIDPRQPDIVWSGTEGGGAIAWNRRTGAFAQHAFPNQMGMPSNRVQDIAFGRVPGEAWLATEGGVARTSGATWTAWTSADGLPEDDVRAIAVAPSGVVWAGTRASGLASWDPRSGAWTTWPTVPFDPAAPGPFDGPGAAAVADLAIGADGRVWVAHGRQADPSRPALSSFDPRAGTWDHVGPVGPAGNPERGPVTDQILALAVDGSGALWAGTWARGVLRFDGERWRTFGADDGPCARTVPALASRGAIVWASCAEERGGAGAARWDGSTWTSWPDAGGGALLLAVAAGADGGAVLGANGPGIEHGGLLPIGPDGRVGARLTTAPHAPPVNDLTALRVASDGALWAGTRGGGLLRYDGVRWSRHTRASSGGRLAGDTVTDLAERDGVLWIASTKTRFEDGAWIDGGVGRLDLATGAWLEPLRSDAGDLPDDDVSSLAVGDDGRVWIGFGAAAGGPGAPGTTHNGNGVVLHNPETGSYEHHGYADSRGGLAGDTVLDLAIGPSGGWVAASHHNDVVVQRRTGGGVSRRANDAWTAWTGGRAGLVSFHGSGKPTDRDPLITGDVRSIHAGRDGVVWAGTYDLLDGTLLERWPWVDAAINRFDGTRWQADVLPGAGWIAAIADDADGRVWAGVTRGHALAEPDPFGAFVRDDAPGAFVREDGVWSALTLGGATRLAPHGVTAIAVDPATGAVWLATENEGLLRFGPPAPGATNTPTGPTREPTPTPSASTTATATATGRPSTPPATPASRQRAFLPSLAAGAESPSRGPRR